MECSTHNRFSYRDGGVKRALIIAAGVGSRFGARTNSTPKPLIPVGGLPLILRTIYTAREVGIREFIVVTGFLGHELETFLESRSPKDIKVRCLYNELWERSNGWSVYRSKDEFQADEPFLLMMSDHVAEPELLRKLIADPLPEGHCRLAVDFNPSRIPDIEEATKVLVDQRAYIRRIGKKIPDYNGVDTGFFLCSKSIFLALEEALSEGKETLSDGIQKLADKGLMESIDIGSVFWQDVDNEEDLRRAEVYLFNSLRSKTDSWLTRHINRRISLAITKRIASLPLTPNQITLINFFIGLAGCFAILHGATFAVLVGTVIFLLSSILDGCDGELARLRFQKSRVGAWLDVTTDNVVHWVLFYAITEVVVRREGFFPYGILGGFLLLGSFISFVLTWFVSESDASRPESHIKLLFSEATFQDAFRNRDTLSSLVDSTANRDFAYLLVLLAIFDRIQWFLVLGGIGAPLFAWILYRRIVSERLS
ncbi:MAG: NTP transferase domain-containing protein [Syntrophobacterales bacterium]|nr:NTP transferase domain-containing protein [Syntrophobacterales bacterium]